MHPVEGRVVLHGHLREGRFRAAGSLTDADVEGELRPLLVAVGQMVEGLDDEYHGCLTLRLVVNPAGTVDRIETLTDRIVRLGETAAHGDLVDRVRAILWSARFPAAPGPSIITVPIAAGAEPR